MENESTTIEELGITTNSHTGELRGYALSFRLFCIGATFVYLNFIRYAFDNKGLMVSESIRAFSIIIGPVFLFLSLLAALREGQLDRINPFYRTWFKLLLFYYAYLLATGLFAFKNDMRHVGLDFILLPFFFAGILMGCKKENWVFFDKFIFVFFTVNIVACLYWIGGFSEFLLSRRHLIITAFDNTPYFFWGNLSIWPYCLLTMPDKSKFRKIVTIAGIVLYFSFAIIFLKRAPFVYLVLFLVLILFSRRKLFKLSKAAFFLFVGVTILWGVFQPYSGGTAQIMVENLKMRFTQEDSVANTLMKEDRLSYDPVLILTQFSRMEYIVGRGLGGVVEDIEGRYPEEMTHSLHNGSALTTLKGGLLLLIIWAGGWLLLFKDFVHSRNRSLDRYYIPVLMPFLFSWVFGFLYASVGFLLLMMCAGRVMARNDVSVY